MGAVEAADADRLKQLITELGDAQFAVREAASKSLSEMGEQARLALEKAVKSSSLLEGVERAKKIMSKVETITPEQLRQMRAVEILELIASDDAKKLLNRWAAGVKGAVLTEEARAALGRAYELSAGGGVCPRDRRRWPFPGPLRCRRPLQS